MKTINLTASYVQMHGIGNDGKLIIELGCGRFRLRLHLTRSLVAPLARVLWKFLREEQAAINASGEALKGGG